MARHMLGPSEAEEVVQDVFLRLWTRSASYDSSRAPFDVWLMTIARNRMLDGLRKRTLGEQLNAIRETEEVFACQADPAMDVEAEVLGRERDVAVTRALAALPPEQRRVLVLAYFGGLTQSALARHLDWPLGTVKKRTKLGLQKLRALLGHQGWPAEPAGEASREPWT
jgi:RNA polymerase sigma-70 factor (ECF subfamily)